MARTRATQQTIPHVGAPHGDVPFGQGRCAHGRVVQWRCVGRGWAVVPLGWRCASGGGVSTTTMEAGAEDRERRERFRPREDAAVARLAEVRYVFGNAYAA